MTKPRDDVASSYEERGQIVMIARIVEVLDRAEKYMDERLIASCEDLPFDVSSGILAPSDRINDP